MQLLRISLMSILSEKKKSISLLVAVSIATIVSLLSISINMSFAVATVEDLREFAPILIIYTQQITDSLSSWVSVSNISALVVSSLMIAGSFFLSTFNMKNQFKAYTLMGASFAQNAIIASVKNVVLFLAGFIGGVILSLLASIIIGAISSTMMIFAIGNVFICLLIDLVLIMIVSIVIPLWS